MRHHGLEGRGHAMRIVWTYATECALAKDKKEKEKVDILCILGFSDGIWYLIIFSTENWWKTRKEVQVARIAGHLWWIGHYQSIRKQRMHVKGIPSG